MLPDRFQEAVDAAAMVAGLIGSDDYTEQMRKDSRECGDDLQHEVDTETVSILSEWDERPCVRRSARAGSGAASAIGGGGGEDAAVAETVVSSATREVVIGTGRPFVIIGERINPTGRKRLAEEMKAGDFTTRDRRYAGAGGGRAPTCST